VSFGQSLDPVVLGAAVEAARDCDIFLAVGSSLQVMPAAGLCDVAVEHGARLAIVNAEETPFDRVAAAVVRERIGIALPAIVGVA
jgi:NAD-dependent deacetylase